MTDITIYKNTDVDITINMTGIDLADITAMTVSLERHGQASILLTSAAGEVTIGASSVNLRIEESVISEAGVYRIRITATENGNLRGLTPAPSTITVI